MTFSPVSWAVTTRALREVIIKFHLIDKRLECLPILLFIYAYFWLPQNRILPTFFFLYRILWFSATKIYLFYLFFVFFLFDMIHGGNSQLKYFFKTVTYAEFFRDFVNALFNCYSFRTSEFQERLFSGASPDGCFWQKCFR